jgi:hypothetical protein
MSLIGCYNKKITKEQSSLSEKKVKEDYKLQVQCGKQCKEYFDKEYGNGFINWGSGEQLTSNYTDHYNKKLNKCFIQITSIEVVKNIENKFKRIVTKTLFDLNENNKYASFIQFENDNEPVNCRILEEYCNSIKEWDSLVKPYMED